MRKLNHISKQEAVRVKKRMEKVKLFTNIDVNHRTEEAIVSRANKATISTITLGEVTRTVSSGISICGSFDWLSSL